MDRTLAREIAMTLLYAGTVGGEDTVLDALEQSDQEDLLDEKGRIFAEELYRGTIENREEIDKTIAEFSIMRYSIAMISLPGHQLMKL